MRVNQDRGSAEPNVLLRRRLRLLAVICVISMVTPTLLSFINFKRTFVIVNDSMTPTLRSGDLILINPVDGEIADETIIVFKSPLGGYQAHRIIDRVTTGDDTYYITKGDANEMADSYLVPVSNIVGVISFVIPRLGMYFLIPRGIALITTITLMISYVLITFKLSTSFTLNFKHLFRFLYNSSFYQSIKQIIRLKEKKKSDNYKNAS